MEIDLKVVHKALAYLMFGFALVNLVLALMPNRNGKVLKILHSAVLNIGRLALLIGISLWVVKWSAAPVVSMWWAWSALLLWGPMEVISKRLVKPDIQYLLDGGESSSKLTMGMVGELVIVTIIFGLMSAKGMRPLIG